MDIEMPEMMGMVKKNMDGFYPLPAVAGKV